MADSDKGQARDSTQTPINDLSRVQSLQSHEKGTAPSYGKDSPVADVTVLRRDVEAQSPAAGQRMSVFADHHEFKDGGMKAWLTVLGSWLVFFSTGIVTAYGVYEAFYVTRHLRGRSPSDVAWIGSLQLCLMFMVGVVAGKLFDEGYFHHTMIIGSIFEVVGLLMLSWSKTYLQIFLSQGVCVGIGLGLLFLPAVTIIQHHFHKKRSLASGIAFSGASIGGIVFTIMLNQFFKPNSSVGFVTGSRITAGMVGGMLLVANLIMRTDLPPRKKRAVQIPLPRPATFFKEPLYVFVLIGVCLSFLAMYFPVFYLQLDAELHGINPTLAFYTLTIYNGASIPGRLLPNFLADKFGIFNIINFCMFSCGVIIVAMLGIKTNGVVAVCVISALYGFFSGAVVALLSPLAPHISNGPHEVGIRLGVIFLFIGPCALLSGPISGWLMGDAFDWWKPIAFSSTVTFVGVAFMLNGQRIVARREGTWLI